MNPAWSQEAARITILRTEVAEITNSIQNTIVTRQELLRRCAECLNDESPLAIDAKLQRLDRCRRDVGRELTSLEVQFREMTEKCEEGNKLIAEFAPDQEPMAVSEFPYVDELRVKVSEVMQKMENKRQELELELNSADQLQAKLNEQKRAYQREYESRRRLLRSCEVAANDVMKVHDTSDIQAKLQELVQLKSLLEQTSFESLHQQWHQNQQTLNEAESGRMAEIVELQSQFSRMISRLDQKNEELEGMLAKWQTVQTMQRELNNLKDRLKTEVQDKRRLLDECEGFVQSLTDKQNVLDTEAKNHKLHEWEERLESTTFKSLRNLLGEIRKLFEKTNMLAAEVGIQQPRMAIPKLSQIEELEHKYCEMKSTLNQKREMLTSTQTDQQRFGELRKEIEDLQGKWKCDKDCLMNVTLPYDIRSGQRLFRKSRRILRTSVNYDLPWRRILSIR
jgi:chromosome segregation ATPase